MVIDEIIDSSFRSGDTNGKPWTLMKVKVGNEEATIFAPASVGDEVTLEFNPKYKSYTAKKLTAAKKDQTEILDKLDEILAILKGKDNFDL